MAFAFSQSPSAAAVRSELMALRKAARQAAKFARQILSDPTTAKATFLEFSGLAEGKLEIFAALAMDVSTVCEKASQNIEFRTSPSRRGRTGHPQLREYIWELAEFFERRGGKASAHYSDAEGYRNTPFVKFIWQLSAGLPAELSWPKTVSAMGEAVKKTLEMRKAAAKRSSPILAGSK
jgi:hypothetical protein